MHAPQYPGMQIQALAVGTREALRIVCQWCCRPVLMAGDLPSASRHQLGWGDNAVIRIIRTNHHSELMNHQPPPEHHGALNKEFLIPRNAADNKHSWKSVALPLSRVQLIKKKATFPFYKFGLSGQFGHLSDFLKIRSWRLDSVTAWRHYKCNYCSWTTQMSSPSKEVKKENYTMVLIFLHSGSWTTGKILIFWHTLLSAVWPYFTYQEAVDTKHWEHR